MNECSCCYTSTARFGVSALNFGHSNRCVVVSHRFIYLFFLTEYQTIFTVDSSKGRQIMYKLGNKHNRAADPPPVPEQQGTKEVQTSPARSQASRRWWWLSCPGDQSRQLGAIRQEWVHMEWQQDNHWRLTKTDPKMHRTEITRNM